jgi:hypothetical protein
MLTRRRSHLRTLRLDHHAALRSARKNGHLVVGRIGLTPRELEVLRLLGLGHDPRRIAKELGVGVTAATEASGYRLEIELRRESLRRLPAHRPTLVGPQRRRQLSVQPARPTAGMTHGESVTAMSRLI